MPKPETDNYLYWLPEDYQENAQNITLDQDEKFYWDSLRIKRSALHQFAVYQWAAKIIEENKVRNIVDVGCGFVTKLAWLHDRFPELEFWGVDQPYAADLCKSHYNFGLCWALILKQTLKHLRSKPILSYLLMLLSILKTPTFFLIIFVRL